VNFHGLLRADVVDHREFGAGRVDKLKRLRAALITTFSPSTLRDTTDFSATHAEYPGIFCRVR